MTPDHRSVICRELSLSLQGEEQHYGMKSTLYVPNFRACVYVCVRSHTNSCVSAYIHTHKIQKHTLRQMCVCFMFSTLGCYCFVAVLGAAAQRVEAEQEEEEGEVLDRHRCLLALAALRHAKWFQVGAHSLPVFLPDAHCSLTIRLNKYTNHPLMLWWLLHSLSLY